MRIKRTAFDIVIMLFLFSASAGISKLLAQPSPVWVSSFNSTNNGNDRAFKSVVDANGNIYLLGTVYNTQTKDDLVLIKYSPSGVKQWERFYYGDADDNEIPVDIELDGQGNVYAAARNYYTYNNFTHERSVIIKYSPNGNLLWTHEDKFAASITRQVKNITISSDNYLYTAGRGVISIGNNSFYTLYIMKLNLSGSRVDSMYNIMLADSFSVTNLYDIITDNSGNVYAAGSRGKNIYTVKYNSNLDSLWSKTYNGAGNGNDAVLKLAFDDNFNVYAGGYSFSANAGNDYIVIKYSNGGAQNWVKTYNGPANGNDELKDMKVQPDGSVYVTGRIAGGSSGYDIGTMRITSAGSLVWTNIYNGSSNGNDAGVSIAVDNAGALYVAGTSAEGSGGTDYTIIKYSTLFANQHWVLNYSLSTSDSLCGMILDNNFNPVIYGHHKRFLNDDRDMGLIKFGSTIGVEPVSNNIPESFELKQNYPNPFNPETRINFSIPQAGYVTLSVFDAAGRQVDEPVNEHLSAGEYNIVFNASKLSSGVYFYKLVYGNNTGIKKMILVK